MAPLPQEVGKEDDDEIAQHPGVKRHYPHEQPPFCTHQLHHCSKKQAMGLFTNKY